MRFVLICGAPGVGKSSLVRSLLGSHRYDAGTRWSIGARYAAVGEYKGAALDGPDGLPLSPALLEATLSRAPADKVCLLDGERYAASTMLLDAAAILLQAPASALRIRRDKRGSAPMSEDWYARRIARATREAGRYKLFGKVDASRSAIVVARAVDVLLRGVRP